MKVAGQYADARGFTEPPFVRNSMMQVFTKMAWLRSQFGLTQQPFPFQWEGPRLALPNNSDQFLYLVEGSNLYVTRVFVPGEERTDPVIDQAKGIVQAAYLDFEKSPEVSELARADMHLHRSTVLSELRDAVDDFNRKTELYRGRGCPQCLG